MKLINRNNYEEFLLLYVDDELSSEEKVAVENFVQQNADVAAELKMLLQTKLYPESSIHFNDKADLLRTEGNTINEHNYQEYFLLYIDNELSTAKREEVETFVLQHPKRQEEFTTLQQTVLIAEPVSFDKSALYRTEKKRIVYMQPFKWLAAACLIGVCAFTFIMFEKNTVTNNPVAVNYPKQNSTVPVQPKLKPTKPIIAQQQNTVAQQPVHNDENNNKTVAVTSSKKQTKKVFEQKPVVNEVNNDIADVRTAKQQLPKTQQVAVVPPKQLIDNNEAALNENTTSQQDDDDNILADNKNTSQQNNGYQVTPVAYKEITPADEDNSVYVAGLDLNKEKVKNLFKKATRLFNNKSSDLANDDGKLQVAGFQINTNNKN